MFAYCNSNPIGNADAEGESPYSVNKLMTDGPGRDRLNPNPLRSCKYGVSDGTGTLAIGVSFSCQGLGYVSIDYAIDSKGNDALLFTIGFDGGTPAIGFDVHATTTEAPSVDDLAGRGLSFGGSVLGLGYDRVMTIDEDTRHAKYFGNSVSIGLRSFCPAVPAEIHATYGYASNIWGWFN